MSEPRIRMDLEHARNLMAQRDAGARGDARVAWDALARAIAGVDNPRTFRAARRSGTAAEPLPFPKPDPTNRKAKKRDAEDEHRERMRVIRGAIWIRAVRVDAGGRDCDPLCEKCGQAPMVDPHHLFGRGKGRPLENERNCVGLCRRCHEWMQHPPTLEAAAEGWDWAGRHLEELGFGDEAAMCWARAKKVRDRAEVTRAGEAVRAAEVSRAGR